MFKPRPPISVKIIDIGSGGDGVGLDENGNKIFIPCGLPGDEMEVERLKGGVKILSHKKLSTLRDTPICPLSGLCGGCALPELKKEEYLKIKNQMVSKILSLALLNAENVEPLFAPLTLGTRRRASFTYRLRETMMALGFNRPGSHWVQDMENCPLLVPEINNLLTPLKKFLTELGCKKGSLNITLTDGGIDILINDAVCEKLDNLALVSEFAHQYNIARICDKFKKTLIEQTPPFMNFSGTKVIFPPASFLQPSNLGETFIRNKIHEYIKKYLPENTKNIADLFCGLGTFSFGLTEFGKVFASDDNKEAIANFTQAVQENNLPITVVGRNLFNAPLEPDELKEFDIIVLDPPRAGAKEQIEKICATSKKFLIIYVSCNEATFGRDGKTLQDAGYKLLNLAPLDQFPFTPHLEVIGVFQA